LHWAAIEGHKEIAELLIAEGADVNAKSEGGTTPLDMANDRETADLLRKHGGKYGTIYGAAGGGDIEAVKEFLAIGADVNAKAGNGTTPLHDAATKEITELLIANGADVNAKDDDGWIPLLYAVEGGYNEIVELLIDKGSDVNVKDKRGFTPLHWVSISGHKEAAELLIDNGADVNAMRGGGGTPLSYAASWGHEEIVELLIANGADVNVKDAFSETPLDVATHPDNPNASAETADLLRKHGGKIKKELEAAGN
jgi:ankyrin repeat protein